MAYGAGRWPAGVYRAMVLVTLSLVLGSFALAIHPWTHSPAGAAAGFVPPDGRRLPAREPDPAAAEQPWWENALVPAEFGARGLPAVAVDLLREVYPDAPHVVRNWSWWRSTLNTPASEDQAWHSRLFHVDDRTVDWMMGYHAGSGEAFDPALTVVPEAPDTDTEWEQEGSLIRVDADGSTTTDYRARVQWESADDPAFAGRGCHAATIELTVAAEDRQPTRLVFCPGQGIVAEVGPGEQVSEAPGDRRAPTPEPVPAAPAWTPEQWTVQRANPTSLPWPDGTDETVGGGLIRPVQTAGGVVVRSNADVALFAMVDDGGERRVDWVVTPGDRILSLRAIGRVLVVTTGDRRVVGYDERGQWLWEADCPDVVLNAAQPVTEDTFAIAGAGGQVELRALVSGELVWQADVGSSINAISADRQAGTVHVIDDTGTLTEFGHDSAEPRWEAEVSAGRAQLVSGGGGVTVLLPNALHRLRDGQRLWRHSLAFANELNGDDHLAYVVADRRLRAYDLATGAVRWSHPAVLTVTVPRQVMDSVAVVAADGASVVALSADGTVLAETDLELPGQGRLVPLDNGVLVHWAPSPELIFWARHG